MLSDRLLSCLLFILFFLLGFNLTCLNAQTGSVAGIVKDAERREPLAGANIILDGTTLGTSTNVQGAFRMESIPAGDYVIMVHYLGYQTEKRDLKIQDGITTELDIFLQPDLLYMENLVIYGEYYLVGRDPAINRETVSLLPATTQISFQDIERQGALTVTDAIKHVPGGWIETRGRKTKQFFSVRGQRYPYPDYSINGIWQKEFEETHYFLTALDIESIEIVRSGSALIKGLSGLTGVVDIKTRKPERESFSAMFRYGEQNSHTSHLRYGNVAGDLAYQVSASFFGTGGPPGLGGKERIANLYGALDWNISSDLHLQTGITYLGGMREFVRIADQPSSSPNILNRQEKFDPIRTFLTYAKLNVHGTNGSLTELQTNLSYRKTDFNNYLISEELTTINAEDDYEFSINLLHNRPLGTAHTLRAGALYHHWAAPEGKRFYAGNRGDIHTWSGVVASEHQAGRFLFDAGLRIIGGYISEWGGFGIEGGAAGLQNIEPIKNETVPLEWQSVLGSTWLLPGPYSLHYTISAGTLAPRTGSLNSEFERPDYEARFQHDLGLLYRSPDLNEFSVTAFYAQRRNALELSGEIEAADAYYVELFQNLDKRTYGVELSGRWNIPWLHSRFFANATLMRGENEIDGDMVKDEKLPNLIINSGILFDYRQWDFNLFIHHTGPYVNNRFVRGPWIAQNGDYPLGDYLSIDLTTGYTFYVGNVSARIFGEVKNLLDERYETVAGYPDPGRLIHGGFRLDL